MLINNCHFRIHIFTSVVKLTCASFCFIQSIDSDELEKMLDLVAQQGSSLMYTKSDIKDNIFRKIDLDNTNSIDFFECIEVRESSFWVNRSFTKDAFLKASYCVDWGLSLIFIASHNFSRVSPTWDSLCCLLRVVAQIFLSFPPKTAQTNFTNFMSSPLKLLVNNFEFWFSDQKQLFVCYGFWPHYLCILAIWCRHY